MHTVPPVSARRSSAAIVALLAALFTACTQGMIGPPGGGDPDGAAPTDGGGTGTDSSDGAIAPGCEGVAPAVMFFSNNCASSGACHVPGGQYPALTQAGLPELVSSMSRARPGQRLITPGDPANSFLYRKLAGMQGEGGGLLMPIGSGEPLPTITVIEQWIRAGAPSRCATEVEVTVPADPNTIPQGDLFTCATPDGGASSPARIRRVERTQWTHSVGAAIGSAAHSNPLYAPPGAYSTYSAGASIDPETLDLYMTSLPTGTNQWSSVNGGVYYQDRMTNCAFNSAAPTDDCIDYYVDAFLTRGALFRSPSAAEHAALRALFVATIAEEGGDRTRRTATLQYLNAAAWMTSGALFRPEMGTPDPANANARRRLTNDELGLAIGNVLSTHPPGSPLPGGAGTDADRAMPGRGWLGLVRAAVADGTIQSPDTMRSLLRAYRGGSDEMRGDIRSDTDARRIPRAASTGSRRASRASFASGSTTATPPRPSKTPPPRRARGSARNTSAPRSATCRRTSTATKPTSCSSSTTRSPARWSRQKPRAATCFARCSRPARGARRRTSRSRRSPAPRTRTAWRSPAAPTATTPPPARAIASPRSASAGATRTRTACRRTGSTAAPRTCPRRAKAAGSRFPRRSARACSRTRPGSSRTGATSKTTRAPCGGAAGSARTCSVSRCRGSSSSWCRRSSFRARRTCARATAFTRASRRGPSRRPAWAATRMNSLGLPFEMFNHAGFLRASDHGMPPDGRSVIDNAPDPTLNTEIDSALELTQLLSNSPHARRCFIRHAFRYFMGRDETLADACTLAAMEAAFARGSFYAMLDALVTSDVFLYRTPGASMTSGGM